MQDRPGVLAAVAGVFGTHHVSIRSMEQEAAEGPNSDARLEFITHRARERDMQATLAELAHLESVDKVGGLIRVVAED